MNGVGTEPLRILVADDNHDIADMLTLLLKLSGYCVETAYDGVEAIELAHEFRPSVVLLDINMPRLDGYEAAKRIRMDSSLEHPTLVAISALSSEEHRRLCDEAGFDAQVVKPVRAGVLQDLLAQECRNHN
jgi:CheY-like chemotaxis protein